jgi:hypothetical protein
MTIRSLALSLALVTTSSPLTLAQQPANAQRILLESTLWGRDYPALLAQLKTLRDAGETTAYVFVDRAAGASAFSTQQAAQTRVERLRTSGAQAAQLQPQFQTLQRQAAPLRVATARLIDGDGFHVVLDRAGGVELLPPALTVQTVRSRLGAPERVTTQTIQSIGDRRPVILTLHQYANGAIAYAESNQTEPGVVERVVLNLSTVVPVVSR